MWQHVLFAVTLAAALPRSAAGEGYQQLSDGLVSVSTKKVVDQDRQTAFEVCAQLIRQEMSCPIEVRLTFRASSGRVLAQASPVLLPEFASPVCTRVALPPEARDMHRWEVSRVRCQR